MSATVSCPHCKGLIVADPTIAGKNVACPHCNGRVIMPGQPVPAPAKPAVVTPQSDGSDPFDFLQQPSAPTSGFPRIVLAKRKPPSKSLWQQPWVLIGGGILVVLIIIGALIGDKNGGHGGGLFGGGTMPRQEFSQAVIGKSQDQVIRAVGRPDNTTEFAGAVMWVYHNRTTDPISGNTDFTTLVTFDGGIVSRVSF